MDTSFVDTMSQLTNYGCSIDLEYGWHFWRHVLKALWIFRVWLAILDLCCNQFHRLQAVGNTVDKDWRHGTSSRGSERQAAGWKELENTYMDNYVFYTSDPEEVTLMTEPANPSSTIRLVHLFPHVIIWMTFYVVPFKTPSRCRIGHCSWRVLSYCVLQRKVDSCNLCRKVNQTGDSKLYALVRLWLSRKGNKGEHKMLHCEKHMKNCIPEQCTHEERSVASSWRLCEVQQDVVLGSAQPKC